MVRKLKIAGHTKELMVDGFDSECGGITEGISVHFVSHSGKPEGPWVIDAQDLKALLREYEEYHSDIKAFEKLKAEEEKIALELLGLGDLKGESDE